MAAPEPVELAPPSCPEALPSPVELLELAEEPASPWLGVLTGGVDEGGPTGVELGGPSGVELGGLDGWSVPEFVFAPPPAGVVFGGHVKWATAEFAFG